MLNTMKNNFSSSLERKIQGYGEALAVELNVPTLEDLTAEMWSLYIYQKLIFCNYGSLSHYGHFRGLDVML